MLLSIHLVEEKQTIQEILPVTTDEVSELPSLLSVSTSSWKFPGLLVYFCVIPYVSTPMYYSGSPREAEEDRRRFMSLQGLTQFPVTHGGDPNKSTVLGFVQPPLSIAGI